MEDVLVCWFVGHTIVEICTTRVVKVFSKSVEYLMIFVVQV